MKKNSQQQQAVLEAIRLLQDVLAEGGNRENRLKRKSWLKANPNPSHKPFFAPPNAHKKQLAKAITRGDIEHFNWFGRKADDPPEKRADPTGFAAAKNASYRDLFPYKDVLHWKNKDTEVRKAFKAKKFRRTTED